jgi:glycosyltransferase involved in cell wall biosynthesis
LQTTLERLRQLPDGPLDIMVADNASSDGTGEMVRREFPAVRLIPQSENKPLVGYNLAFRAVTTPYVLVLDDDSTPQPGTLAKMIACLERNPGIGAAAGNIVGPDGASEWAAKAETDFSADWYNLIVAASWRAVPCSSRLAATTNTCGCITTIWNWPCGSLRWDTASPTPANGSLITAGLPAIARLTASNR